MRKGGFTLGQSREGRLTLIVHTYVEIDTERVAIRIISAGRQSVKSADMKKGHPHERRV